MSAQAQSPIPTLLPISSEHTASPGAGSKNVVHTGTDVIDYDARQASPNDPQQNQTMQVMTWDEGTDKVYVSWDFYDNTASSSNVRVSSPTGQSSAFIRVTPSSNGQKADPDIVLGYDAQKNLYANIVYVSGDRVNYKSMPWNYTTRTFDVSVPSILLGDSRYQHSCPNIDANDRGLTAVTWQQNATDVVNISVTSTSNYFPSYVFPQTITFGRSVLAAGDIRGNFRSCYRDGITGTFGVPVINPPTGLLEQTLNPDVAISNADESQAIISSVFVRHFVNGRGLFSIENKVAVVQTRYGQCGKPSGEQNPNPSLVVLLVADKYEWAYSEGNVIGTPRIAAPTFAPTSSRDLDVEVAIDRTIDFCGAPQYAIRNYGKSNGAFRPDYTLISPAGASAVAANLLYSVEPAITYTILTNDRVTVPSASAYAISWTGGPGYGANSAAQDVWTVLLNEGRFTTGATGPLAQAPGYSRVNLQGNGNQRSASIAGRYLRPILFLGKGETEGQLIEPRIRAATIHLFHDEGTESLGYRRSDKVGGVGQLRPAGAPTGLLQAYPNPSDGKVALGFELHKGEVLRSVRVFDALGRPVADLPLPAHGTDPVEWQPAATVPVGVYSVRAVTNERTASVSITRQ